MRAWKKACFTSEMRQLLVSRCYYFGNALWHLQICTQLMNEWKLGRLKLVEKNKQPNCKGFWKPYALICPETSVTRNLWLTGKSASCWYISEWHLVKSVSDDWIIVYKILRKILPSSWPRVTGPIQRHYCLQDLPCCRCISETGALPKLLIPFVSFFVW